MLAWGSASPTFLHGPGGPPPRPFIPALEGRGVKPPDGPWGWGAGSEATQDHGTWSQAEPTPDPCDAGPDGAVSLPGSS